MGILRGAEQPTGRDLGCVCHGRGRKYVDLGGGNEKVQKQKKGAQEVRARDGRGIQRLVVLRKNNFSGS